MSKPTLVMGRVTPAKGGGQAIQSLNISAKKIEVLEHQKRTAALIAAAYLYRDNPIMDNLFLLGDAAKDL